MQAYHDSHSTTYRDPFGAAPIGSRVTIRLLVREPEDSLSCSLVLSSDSGEADTVTMRREEGDECFFAIEIALPGEPGLVFYHFALEWRSGFSYYGNNPEKLGGVGSGYASRPEDYQITVYRPSETPAWYREGIAYQIFTDRFRRGKGWLLCQERALRPDSHKGPKRILRLDWDDIPHYERYEDQSVRSFDCFGGNFSGIREKLLYLKSLGVTVLYLNPVFEAASNHKYDTGDYFRIDPQFGDDEGFRELAREADELGIHIILDGVFSHTGADSRYFNIFGNYPDIGACQDQSSPCGSWYSFEHYPDVYACWWGVKDLPNVNELEPSYVSFICGREDGVIVHWLGMGADGWRLDVADELPEEFIVKVREVMRERFPDSVLMGEVWEDASNKVSYGHRRTYLLGDGLQSVMNYPFREAALDYMLGRSDAGTLCRKLMSQYENYPPEAFYSNFNLIGSHDRERVLSVLGGAPDPATLSERARGEFRLGPHEEYLAKQKLKVLSLIQFSMPGIPCIYYGDEAGMQGLSDPYNRGTFPWGREDQDLFYHYRTVTTLRKQHPVLAHGDFVPGAYGADVFGCLRSDEEETIQILANRSEKDSASVSLKADSPYALELLRSTWIEAEDSVFGIELPPMSGAALLFMDEKPVYAARERAAGVICPLKALPSAGEKAMLSDACSFLDFLYEAGMKLWQILPMNPPDYSGSPYSSRTAFASDTELVGSLSRDAASPEDDADFAHFCAENAYWLDDYALYTVLKSVSGGAPWYEWPEEMKNRVGIEDLVSRCAAGILEEKRAQFCFDREWKKVRRYAAEKGIVIIGDMPLSVNTDSADVWSHPEYFELDETGHVRRSAGVPPDYYSGGGQNWGNPVYDWDAMKKDGYIWWKERLKKALRDFDFVRIDHFRGFSEYFSIPAGLSPAEGGWRNGPGQSLFRSLESEIGGPLPILAEDLGNLDSGVYNLLKLTGFPGMDVYQFEEQKMLSAKASEAKDRIYYSSTHDSQTLLGFAKGRHPGDDALSEAERITDWLLDTPADWVIFQLQDVLGLDDTARYNTPGTIDPANWSWRADGSMLTHELARSWAARLCAAGR